MKSLIAMITLITALGITALNAITIPYLENFDGVTAPALPSGWTEVETSPSPSFARTASGNSHSAPNHLNLFDHASEGTVFAVMPPVDDHQALQNCSISFWARATTLRAEITVGTMDAEATADSFNPINFIWLETYWKRYTCNLAVNSNSQNRIAFKISNENVGTQVKIDDLELQYTLSHDLELSDLSVDPPIFFGQNALFSVKIVNQGNSTINAYSIELLDASGTVLASTDGSPIQAGLIRHHSLYWSIPGPGNHVLHARMVCASDLNPANNLSEPIVVAASPPGTQLFDTANFSQYQSKYPIDLYWKTSLCETLYLSTELPDEDRAIWGLCYSAEIHTPTIGIKPIKVWMGHSRLPDLSQGWIPASELQQVFDGQVSFLPGSGRIDLSFSQPFHYEAGNNLAIMVLRPLDSQYYTSMDDFYCDDSSIPRTLKVQSDTALYNPEDPPQTQANTVKPVTFFLITEPVNSADDTAIPSLNSLTVYPNPFNPSTTIAFSLNRSGTAKVLIYNLKGQLVRTLQDGPLRSGTHRLVWDGKDQKGNTMASGVYLCRMELAGQSQARKLVMIK